ncbi:twin-arginine translocation signal domain-containing protein [Acidisoma cellulosilytica]|uniref:Twin-arginine translocation signal domain-containing protein n=1 Tax=Acidisoma cellulosilyticum TaxID=2802395 RepID=A0A963Z3I9_9PROT|nr:twin-arginine translocation signal domain-containing protein [Acidisoma cellulosilyticum]MCB8881300.1 twin-arginine translocation signal domain-containing protein [Acidisoma cellulosilyticum]
MKDRFSTHTQLELSRRDMFKGALGLAAVAATGGLAQQADAAESTTVRAYGVTTAQLTDWSVMQKSLGITMNYTGSNNDVGVYMQAVMQSGLGNSEDIFIFEGGTQNILGPHGAYLPIDVNQKELTLWSRTPDAWKHSGVVVGSDGKQWGTPVIGNADSFGYIASKIGVNPNGLDDVSWGMLLDSDKTRGRAAFDQTWNYSLPSAALYLKATGKAKIDNPGDPTGEEARAVVDFLVARKKAGQFRTLENSFEQQIQLLTNGEVDIINCWEPAAREANKKLGPNAVCYAYTVEGYYKWGHGAYIASQAASRGNLDNIYKVLNYFMDGEYRAYQARDRGYAGPNMDLGVAYAQAHNWSADQIAELKATQVKVDRKFQKPFVSTTTPSHADAIEDEWQRFLNA